MVLRRWTRRKRRGGKDPGRTRQRRASDRIGGTGSSYGRICSLRRVSQPSRVFVTARVESAHRFFSPRTLADGTSNKQLGQ